MYRALCVLLLAASSMAFRLPRKDAVPFILNGEDADEGEWPHQGSLLSFGSHTCGASYLGGVWAVTAAHCIGNPSSYDLVLGVTQRSDAGNDETYSIAEFYEHPDYSPFTLEADHAVIELNEVPSGDNVEAIFVDDTGGDAWVGAECWITGWGQNDNGVAPDNLLEAATLALSQGDCEDWYDGTGYDIYEDMICVGHDNDVYTGACYGDSGGPFVCRQSSGDAWTLVGVTSWAYPPCGNDEYPSVYSRSAYYRDWVSETCGGCI